MKTVKIGLIAIIGWIRSVKRRKIVSSLGENNKAFNKYSIRLQDRLQKQSGTFYQVHTGHPPK